MNCMRCCFMPGLSCFVARAGFCVVTEGTGWSTPRRTSLSEMPSGLRLALSGAAHAVFARHA